VLDVKVGSGAFMKSRDSARELAQTMVDLGTEAGVHTRALITNMDTPLGRAVGNAVEVAEAVEVLSGGGPSDVVELTLALARHMLALVGRDDVDPARALRNGQAMDVWRKMVHAQGGDPDAPLAEASCSDTYRAPATGVVTRLDAYQVGVAAWRLGAGRSRREDAVQSGAGIYLHAKPGETITQGDPLFTLYTDTPQRLPRARQALEAAYDVVEEATFTPEPIVWETITGG
ncbi:MAG TPA: thymidine phosphorylase, partial [Beutenbergiaceae bacterium]|nr:thymidine phosphorylase [Beutenbergiaceae bacterium]